jgi:hypothetical protein
MKCLEGQQQEFRGALKHLQTADEKDEMQKYMSTEKEKHEKRLKSPLGAEHWQDYLKGALTALERIEEIMSTK